LRSVVISNTRVKNKSENLMEIHSCITGLFLNNAEKAS
jgi:hypothetical protein